jgi:hypothetical protein
MNNPEKSLSNKSRQAQRLDACRIIPHNPGYSRVSEIFFVLGKSVAQLWARRRFHAVNGRHKKTRINQSLVMGVLPKQQETENEVVDRLRLTPKMDTFAGFHVSATPESRAPGFAEHALISSATNQLIGAAREMPRLIPDNPDKRHRYLRTSGEHTCRVSVDDVGYARMIADELMQVVDFPDKGRVRLFFER